MSAEFIKRYPCRELYEEALSNSKLAYDASLKSRFLRVPKITSEHPDDLAIGFEMMADWLPLMALLRDYHFLGLPADELEQTFFMLGAALAEYHLHTGRIHRDFDSTNVLFRKGENQICLIDFSRPDFADRPDYYIGSIYWDIALMLIHLRVKYPPYKMHCLLRRRNREISRYFLRGYFCTSNVSFDFSSLQAQYHKCLELEYLRKIFSVRFMRWSGVFSLEDLQT